MKMAETLAFWVRLLVVRYLAFVVVRAETIARVNAGAIYLTGAAGVRFRRSLLQAVERWSLGTECRR